MTNHTAEAFKNTHIPKWTVEVWETRSYTVPVEASDADEAKEIAKEVYTEQSIKDEFVDVEIRSAELEQ